MFDVCRAAACSSSCSSRRHSFCTADSNEYLLYLNSGASVPLSLRLYVREDSSWLYGRSSADTSDRGVETLMIKDECLEFLVLMCSVALG